MPSTWLDRGRRGGRASGSTISSPRSLKGVPKSHVYRILRSGEVRVNKGRVGPDARLAAGDVVRDAAGAHRAPERPADAGRRRRASGRPILLRGRRAARDRQARRPRGARRQRHRARRDRAVARGAARGAVPRARAPARPRHVGRAAGREEALGADGAARAAARRATSTSAISCWCAGRWRDAEAHRRRCRCTSSRRATASAACASTRRPGGRDDLSPRAAWPDARSAARAARGRARRPAARTRSACTSRTSGIALAGDDKYGDFAWNQALAQEGPEADVPARAADGVRASGERRRDARRVAAAGGAGALSGDAGRADGYATPRSAISGFGSRLQRCAGRAAHRNGIRAGSTRARCPSRSLPCGSARRACPRSCRSGSWPSAA